MGRDLRNVSQTVESIQVAIVACNGEDSRGSFFALLSLTIITPTHRRVIPTGKAVFYRLE